MKDYSQLVQDVLDGNEDPVRAWAILTLQEEYIKLCFEKIEDQAKQSAIKRIPTGDTHGSFSQDGCTFHVRTNVKLPLMCLPV